MNAETDTDTEPGYFGKEDPSSGATTATEDRSEADPAQEAPPEPADGGADDDRHMGHLDEGHSHGPTDGQYFTIFWVLLGLTALEVSTYFWESWFGDGDVIRRVGVGVLLVLMVIKFLLITGFFMHLRFDAAMVRRVFGFGMLVAIVIYTMAMTSLNVWTHSGTQRFNDPPPPVTTTTLPEGG